MQPWSYQVVSEGEGSYSPPGLGAPMPHRLDPPARISPAAPPLVLRASVFPIASNRPRSVIASTLNPDLQRTIPTELLSDAGAPHQRACDGLSGQCGLPLGPPGEHSAVGSWYSHSRCPHSQASHSFRCCLLWELTHFIYAQHGQQCFLQASQSPKSLGFLPECCTLCPRKVLPAQ